MDLQLQRHMTPTTATQQYRLFDDTANRVAKRYKVHTSHTASFFICENTRTELSFASRIATQPRFPIRRRSDALAVTCNCGTLSATGGGANGEDVGEAKARGAQGREKATRRPCDFLATARLVQRHPSRLSGEQQVIS